jgi:hypothetical protein
VTFTNKSYISKTSFYNCDPLPKYDEPVPEFSGRRKHHGLYVSKDGFAVNTDVNANLNIGRKVIREFSEIRGRNLPARPVMINPLKT